MSVSYPDRAPIRKAIAALLSTALSGIASVVDYLVVDPDGKSPLVYVASASTSPDEQVTPYGGVGVLEGFNVGVLVIYSQGNTWTPAMCEDKSDQLSKIIFQTIANNANHPSLWSHLFVPLESQPSNEPLGGQRYRIELIPVAALVATSNDAA